MDLEEILWLLNNQMVWVWSPFDAYEAAATLSMILEANDA
jgi:hypothetical protein